MCECLVLINSSISLPRNYGYILEQKGRKKEREGKAGELWFVLRPMSPLPKGSNPVAKL